MKYREHWDTRIIRAIGDAADLIPEKPTWRWYFGAGVIGFLIALAVEWAKAKCSG